MKSAQAPLASTISTNKLRVIERLFADLHRAAVVYCHWKSNEHLGASMIGATDLDVLVDRSAATEFERILGATGFKCFPAVQARRYPGITDWLGFDHETGALVHLHVHYQMTVGEPHLKGYRLPWEHVILGTRVLDPEFGLFVADPHVEVVLLLVRAALKVRTRDTILGRGRRAGFNGGGARELRWLADRVDEGRLSAVATSLVGEAAARSIVDMVRSTSPTRNDLRALRGSCRPDLRMYRFYGGVEARRRRWLRELAARVARIRRGSHGSRQASRRLSTRGGTMIAFVGADGAGKSSLTAEIANWLGGKLDVVTVYGGSGVGTAAPMRRLLRGAVRLIRGQKSAPSVRSGIMPSEPGVRGIAERSGAENGDRLSPIDVLATVIRSLLIDRERRSRLRQAWRARSAGMIVLSDRFPQSQFPGLNDGPRLGRWSGAGWPLRAAVTREEETFRHAECMAPDLVVKLVVPFEVAARRKPDTPATQLRRKIDIVSQLRYEGPTKVVTLDAAAEWEQVLLRAKRCVWAIL